jgi:hypothetical protein
VDDLKVVIRHGRRRRCRQGIEVVHEDEVAPVARVQQLRDFGEGLRETGADNQKPRASIASDLQIDRRSILRPIVQRKAL